MVEPSSLPVVGYKTKHELIYEGQSISNETFSITQVCNDW